MSFLATPAVPIYVTRQDGDGECGVFAIGGLFFYLLLLAIPVAILNVFVWGLVGLYAAVRVVL